MLLLTRALYRWIQTGVLRTARRIRKVGEFLPQLNRVRSWAILAIAQGLIVLVLLLTWPRSVTLSLVLPESEATAWLPLIQDFQRQNPDIQIAPIVGSFTTDDMEAIYRSDSDPENVNPSYDLLYLDMIWVQQFA